MFYRLTVKMNSRSQLLLDVLESWVVDDSKSAQHFIDHPLTVEEVEQQLESLMIPEEPNYPSTPDSICGGCSQPQRNCICHLKRHDYVIDFETPGEGIVKIKIIIPPLFHVFYRGNNRSHVLDFTHPKSNYGIVLSKLRFFDDKAIPCLLHGGIPCQQVHSNCIETCDTWRYFVQLYTEETKEVTVVKPLKSVIDKIFYYDWQSRI